MNARNPNGRPEQIFERVPRIRADTIVATATGPGIGAIAVVRVSGPLAEQICRRVVAPVGGWPLRPRRATCCQIHSTDDTTNVLDNALVTYFPAPRSYTGEHILELATHGGAYTPLVVCGALLEAGARAALPGEFTERAVFNGKLDLLRAEAVADLIEARTNAMHRIALKQLSGALSERLASLRSAMIEIEALLAYDIDFPEEDSGYVPHERVLEACDRLVARLEVLIATTPAAILGRDGATVVIAGAPNVGKSSLLNALVGERRVIVSDTPGTTRDAVEVLLEHDPWPIRLVDTAGLRDDADPLERLGIEVSEHFLARAHAVIVCGESAGAVERTASIVRTLTQAPIVGACTKADLVNRIGSQRVIASYPVVHVSALRGDGLNDLLAAVTTVVNGEVGVMDPETPVIVRARHRAALIRAKEELTAFRFIWADRTHPAPVAAVHVREARTSLDELIGVVDVEDVFRQVFSTFCIGK